MGCQKIHVDQYDYDSLRCSYKSLLVGLGLVCSVIFVLGTLEERDGHVVIRSAAVPATRKSMVAENMKLQVVFEDEEKKPSEEDNDHHMTQYRPPSTASPGKEIVDINYMSKRRVPNGADPIHNRRAGKSRRPPSKT